MNRDLARMLQEAVPEPTGRLDPDEILRTAGRARPARRWAAPVLAVTVLAVAVGVASPQLMTRWRNEAATPVVADVPLTVSALEHRVPLPEAAAGAAIGLGGIEYVHPGEGTLVATVGDDEIYLAEATGDRLCVVVGNELTGGGGSNGCQPMSDLLTTGVGDNYGGGVHLTAAGMEPTFWRFIVAAPDGYTLATANDLTALITSNVAVLDLDITEAEVTISGPAVPSVTFHIGVPGSLDGATPPTREAYARANLESLARDAQAYLQQHGTTAGYADSVKADADPRMDRLIPSLTNTTATATVGTGHCLTIDFQTNQITEATCT